MTVHLRPALAALSSGDPAPRFTARSPANPAFAFDTAAGRNLVLLFVPSSVHPGVPGLLAAVSGPDTPFDDRHASLFVVTPDPADEAEGRVANRVPGVRVFWDTGGAVAALYGVVPGCVVAVVIDPTLRVVDVRPCDDGGAALLACVAGLPPPGLHAGFPVQAPVLILPRVFEPDLCARLIALYDAQGGEVSGFMRQVDGRTVGLHDRRHKVRRDVTLTDPALIATTRDRIARRVVPEIAKVHMFDVTRMERYLIACYDGAEGGHFAPHRDNTTKGTAHRRFAVSVNLNDGFDGGAVSFPEYGAQGFRPPAGGAVVFSCALLHAVSPVMAGRRYAFLPFLYDEAAARIRAANLHLLGPGLPRPGGTHDPPRGAPARQASGDAPDTGAAGSDAGAGA
ncbi:MAG: 2OG-Fe(II) oxygenase [Rhodobacteraceae bacterium]|jgi:predicted 2-oxoglutarate/Fe(II)-dependent dioxygenase YbiX/peroxiredoxin|nr:2OG-Fe(II) oxygenase [Paracoccaceae bacterium]